jgi:cytochrome P450
MGRPIYRIETPAGDPAWRVCGHSEVKALLGDQRLGKAHPDPPSAGWYSRDDLAGRPIGGSETEYAEHTAWRKAMNRVFSPQDLERCAPDVTRIAAETAGALAACATPVDLSDAFSTPFASRVICHLIGVPDEDIPLLREWTEEGGRLADMNRSLSGITRMMGYVNRMVRDRRGKPGSDTVSLLLATAAPDDRMHQGRVVKLVAGMLAFGRETPASSLNWAVMLLLANPEQLRLVRADPRLLRGAVEESLRLFKPPAATDEGLLRYAHTDIEIAGVTIEVGDMVLLDLVAANHDSAVFPDPERFDVRREPNQHVAFGHGFYMCNFTRLARVELTIALRELLDRFPGLRLAVAPEQLEFKHHLRTGGLAGLPVAW